MTNIEKLIRLVEQKPSNRANRDVAMLVGEKYGRVDLARTL